MNMNPRADTMEREAPSLAIQLHTFGMSREDRQLEEIDGRLRSARPGQLQLFPEYAAYTEEGSRIAYDLLERRARETGATIITTLNHTAPDLPHGRRGVRYNTLFVFSRNGRVYAPQAKVTPQSFEMKHMDEKSPVINVAPYTHLNRVTLKQGNRKYSALFLICSDLYLLRHFSPEELRADILFCPANFGNGAEGPAGRLIDRLVQSGIFHEAYYVNCYQPVKGTCPPLTVAVQRAFQTNLRSHTPVGKAEIEELVKAVSVVYPDDTRSTFQSMLELTQSGRFTVPHSRSADASLVADLGRYDPVIEV